AAGAGNVPSAKAPTTSTPAGSVAGAAFVASRWTGPGARLVDSRIVAEMRRTLSVVIVAGSYRLRAAGSGVRAPTGGRGRARRPRAPSTRRTGSRRTGASVQ